MVQRNGVQSGQLLQQNEYHRNYVMCASFQNMYISICSNYFGIHRSISKSQVNGDAFDARVSIQYHINT